MNMNINDLTAEDEMKINYLLESGISRLKQADNSIINKQSEAPIDMRNSNYDFPHYSSNNTNSLVSDYKEMTRELLHIIDQQKKEINYINQKLFTTENDFKNLYENFKKSELIRNDQSLLINYLQKEIDFLKSSIKINENNKDKERVKEENPFKNNQARSKSNKKIIGRKGNFKTN